MTKSVKINGFPGGKNYPGGVNNRADSYAIPSGQARALINMDVLDDGHVRSRTGYSKTIAGTMILGAVSYDSRLLYVDGTNFKNSSGTVLRSGLVRGRPHFLEINSTLYVSNGHDSFIVDGGSVRDWVVPNPIHPPALTSISGALPAGSYSFIYTNVSVTGEESGCSVATDITLSADGGIQITLPSSGQSGVTRLRLYATHVNGEVHRLIADTTPGTTHYITSLNGLHYGVALSTRYLFPFPACVHLTHYNGRIYGASGNVVWYTEPLRYGLHSPSRNYIPFPEQVTGIFAAADGLYVGSDQIYWLAGSNPDEFKLDVALPCRLAENSISTLPVGQEALCVTERGVATMKKGGIIDVYDDTIAVDPATEGATIYVERDGVTQFVGVGRAPTHTTVATAMDYMDAEIIRGQ
jgi:hypothetical protein